MKKFNLAIMIPGMICGEILVQVFGVGLGIPLFILAYIASLIIYVRIVG